MDISSGRRVHPQGELEIATHQVPEVSAEYLSSWSRSKVEEMNIRPFKFCFKAVEHTSQGVPSLEKHILSNMTNETSFFQ